MHPLDDIDPDVDQSELIEISHLESACAVWEYCRRSIVHLFGHRYGNSHTENIALALQEAGATGLTRTALSGELGRHASKAQMQNALEDLEGQKLVRSEREQSDIGPPTTTWYWEGT